MPSLFSDHMMLQANAAVTIWGRAEPAEKITVTAAEQTAETSADADGKWKVKLQPMPAGKQLTLEIAGTNKLSIHDVLTGEVWLCAGQSNMGIPVRASLNGEKEAASANLPELRIFTVAPHGAATPAEDSGGAWQVCTPSVALNTTAVGFYFARALHEGLHTPAAIIHASVGGSPIAGWISEPELAKASEYHEDAAAKIQQWKRQPEDAKHFPSERESWESRYGQKPPPNEGAAKGWAAPDFDDHDWKPVALPAKWQDCMGVKQGGVFWLRKTVELPAGAAGKSFMLVLNYMHEQYDTTYFNGGEIGHSGDEPPYYYLSERRYNVPGRLVKPGRNVISIRVAAANPRSDLLGRGAHGDYNLPADPKSVGNEWRCKVESLFPPLTREAVQSRPRLNPAIYNTTPCILYNAMIHPLTPFAIRGVVWYQGESDSAHPAGYSGLLARLIESWRSEWKKGDLPFVLAQLCTYLEPPKTANDWSGCAEIRAAQAEMLRREPEVGLAVTIDLGDGNPHPKNKLDVGQRLARTALAQTYGQGVECEGPAFKSMEVDGEKARLHFSHSAGLTARGGPPRWFAIAGEDHIFHWAQAEIDGECIVVSSPEVRQPVAVRYAWADAPEGCNLYNGAGLPAMPFRTDH